MNLLSRLAGRMSGLLVVVAACVGGYLLIHSLPGAGPKASKDASKAAEEEISVTLSPVKARAIRRTVRVVGGLQGQEEVLLSAKVEGRIKRLRHEVGDQVASGEVILEIEDRDYKLLVEEERRALAVDLAKLGIEKPPQGEMELGRVPLVERARRLEENSRAKYERVRRLGGAATREEQQTSETEAQVARSNLDAAYLDARALLASVRQRQALLETREQKLRDTQVMVDPLSPARAAAAGLGAIGRTEKWVVAQRMVSEGELARIGTPLVRVVLDDPLKLQAALPERESNKVKVGQSVEVAVEAWPGRKFAGTVSRVNPTVDPASRTFFVEVQLPNPARDLRAGMFARGVIVVGAGEGALTVPEEALASFAGVVRLFVAEGGRARALEVTMGERGSSPGSAAWVEVIPAKGGRLAAGDMVVASGLARISDGAAIRARGSD
jgi:multidrug efflux pump subunit AcrA (membrane-fusion protein)